MAGDPAQEPIEVLLTRVGAAVTRHRRRTAARYGLTPTAIAVLGALDPDAGPVPSHRDLAGRLGLSPATLTPVLDVLEKGGQVRRDRDPADRRIVRVHRTPAGRDLVATAARSPTHLPQPAPEIEPAVRAYLLSVLAVVEAQD